ncbi:MAG: helicase C-terminal domain-containing protein, partial [Dehalococcoidia bacterium]
AELLEQLKARSGTVIFGTSSFWEGVDVVGDALSLLIITKLPFSVPTDPVFAARSALFDEPFREYALPQAVLKFKQGFGRLIRHKADRGVVVVLDRRLRSKGYGRMFLDSLSACSVSEAPAAQLPNIVSRWLAARPS